LPVIIKHIGFDPIDRDLGLEGEITRYRSKKAKDALNVPIRQPLPTALIKKIIKHFLVG